MIKLVLFAALLAFVAAKPLVVETVEYPVEYSSPITVEYSPFHYSDYYDSHYHYDYAHAYPYSYYFR